MKMRDRFAAWGRRTFGSAWRGSAFVMAGLAGPAMLAMEAEDLRGQLVETPVIAVPGARPITLDEAVEIALRRNPTLLQAFTSIEIAEHNRLSAYGAFLPSVNMSFGYSNSSTGRLDALGQGIVSTSYSTQLSASYNLFDGWRRFTDLAGARLGVIEQNARYREAEFATIRAVKQAYSATIAARELVGVEERRLARQQAQLEFVQQQLELGRATRSDELRSQVDVNNAQRALLIAQNDVRTTTFRLTEVVGSESMVAPVPEAALAVDPLQLTRDELFALAEVAPAVVTATASVDAAESALSSARSSYLPSINISGGWGWVNQEFPPANRSWSLSVSGSYPIFNGFQRETQVFRARASADQARQAQRAAELNLSSELDAAYATALSALAGIDLAEQNVELSTESLRVVQERYELGLATILELQDAQITLTQAEVDLVNGRFSYDVAIASIEALLGRSISGL